jgi:hypothetical protein
MLALKSAGSCHWNLWPCSEAAERAYSDQAGPPSRDCQVEGAHHRTVDAAIIDSDSKLLTFLGLGYPVAFGIPIYESIQQTDANGFFHLFGGNTLGGHCMRLLGYSKSKNLAVVGNSWPNWGARSSDSYYAPMNGFTNIGYCPLDELMRYFAPRPLSTGETEAVILSKNERFTEDTKPLIRSYTELFT